MATPTASARSWMSTNSSSRRSGGTSLESRTPRTRCSGVTTTAAATTGPASGPRPASSTPATRAKPARHACPSCRYGAVDGAMRRHHKLFGVGGAARGYSDDGALFLQAGRLAGQAPKVIELRAAYLAVPDDIDLVDARGV